MSTRCSGGACPLAAATPTSTHAPHSSSHLAAVDIETIEHLQSSPRTSTDRVTPNRRVSRKSGSARWPETNELDLIQKFEQKEAAKPQRPDANCCCICVYIKRTRGHKYCFKYPLPKRAIFPDEH
jgi:hypothetical protein